METHSRLAKRKKEFTGSERSEGERDIGIEERKRE
jgi:hypothetical protein